MEQRCHLAAIWLTWFGLPLLAVVVGLRAGLVTALAVLGLGILGQVLYVRWFPHISRWLGYGSVADTPAAPPSMAAHLPHVTLYTASVCPFCPIIRRRLAELQRQSQFDVEEVDVTFRPEIIRAKGLRSVPVLEADGRLLVGNATSAQIAEFLRTAAK
ncbi:MAG TPA: glutaredoxin family protein [Vicinamibacterales bacterium]